jgi:rhodanese-related sulfurtransferase
MKSIFKFSIIQLLVFAGIVMIPAQAFSQSTTYKALLKTLYDSEFPALKPEQITDLHKYQILDTREQAEFEVSHLEDAQWVGYDTFEMISVAHLDKTKPILVYCTVGARSEDIGKKLRTAGFTKVYNLYGGIIHWANEEQPLYHEDSITNRVHTYSMTWGIWLNKGEKVY